MSDPELGGESEYETDREALVAAFVTESDEVLASMEQMLLALEAKPAGEETLHSLFRAAHTLEGSSSLVAFDAALGRMFQGIRGISGSAILEDGRGALFLDVPGLLRDTLCTAPAAA